MAKALKDYYDRPLLEKLAEAIKSVVTDFNESDFLTEIFSDPWNKLELKQRMRHISMVMQQYLAQDYEESLSQILKIIALLKSEKDDLYGFVFMVFPDYVEKFGLNNYELSMRAMEKITQFASCEFAIRPYLLQFYKETIEWMKKWSNHENKMVRRLASEGCRPWLPWAMAVPTLKENPSDILIILENLKNDPSETVRRSVANNLNDISRDHPDIVREIAKSWLGQTSETDKLVKHACRTLLKNGDQEVMKLFGYGDVNDLGISGFELKEKEITIGESQIFHFELTNISKKTVLVRLEYGVYLLRSKGTWNRKVFKISERLMSSGEKIKVEKKQHFQPITTRRYYPGKHRISLIINGIESAKKDFILREK